MKVLPKKTKREKSTKEPCFFLEKLFKILKSKENWKIINWSEDGTKVIIFDTIKFSNKILPKYFNHKNYSSFVRQLNIYGFNKINNIYNLKSEQYFNEYFQRDKTIEEIREIKRKNISYENNKNKEEIKKKKILNSIDKEDDEKKIIEYKKLIQNGKMNNK